MNWSFVDHSKITQFILPKQRRSIVLIRHRRRKRRKWNGILSIFRSGKLTIPIGSSIHITSFGHRTYCLSQVGYVKMVSWYL